MEPGSKPAADALLDDDFGTFWESDEGNRKGPPSPWVIIRFSQLDALKHCAIRISPADEKDDALVRHIIGISLCSRHMMTHSLAFKD